MIAARIFHGVPLAVPDDVRAGRQKYLGDLIAQLAENPIIAFTGVQLDSDHEGCGRTALRSWEALSEIAPEADWLLQLSDDVALCQGFAPILTAALTQVPATVPVVSLFNGRRALLRKYARSHWLRSSGGLCGQALVFRTPALRSYLTHYRRTAHLVDPRMVSDDVPINVWLILRELDAWVTNVSLVEHIGELSAMGHRTNVGRPGPAHFTAACFMDELPDWMRASFEDPRSWRSRELPPRDPSRILNGPGERTLSAIRASLLRED